MIKQIVVPIALVLAFVALIACTPAAQNPTDAPAGEEVGISIEEEAAAPVSDQIDVDQLSYPEVLDIDQDTPLCAIFPMLDGDGQQYIARGAENGDGLATKFGLSHGEVVVDTILQEIGPGNVITDPSLVTPDEYRDAVVVLVVDNFMNPSGNVVVPEKALEPNERLLIVGVDIGSWEIDIVTQTIESEMMNLISDPDDPVVTKFVINLSFALVPCNDGLKLTRQQYESNTLSFNDFSLHLNALLAATYGPGHENVPNQISAGGFVEFTKCLYGGDLYKRTCGKQLDVSADTNIILVGAAGNSIYPFAFAPAMWAHVVSVSASDINGDKASYSNTGEIMMAGTTRFSQGSDSIVGTSFASPLLALREALYLRDITDPAHGIGCEGDAQIYASPPLGYIPEAGDWETNTLQTDLSPEDAFDLYCR